MADRKQANQNPRPARGNKTRAAGVPPKRETQSLAPSDPVEPDRADGQPRRGRLKIFLGYAAGVGKTYAMLEAAQQRKAEGLDVLVGSVETHGLPGTSLQLEGLEIMPPVQEAGKDEGVGDIDVDAILVRKPDLVLVDELARTNQPGSRHARRYQSVQEILQHGINVYTTLNIQQLESLNDVVAQITGTRVGDTIPDGVIDAQTDIELVDLPPDELIQRLREGKVYFADQAQQALQEFFRKGNLTALRELTLRRAAERVDDQMRAYMQTRLIPGPWSAGESLLVCISPDALGERLIRMARRLADELKASWSVLYVETPEQGRLSQGQRDQIARSLRLAEDLGAKVSSLPGQAVADSVVEYARSHNVTKIIAGKPVRSRWSDFLRPSVVDQLIRLSGDIDVYVISSDPEPTPARTFERWQPHRPWKRYIWALGLVAAAGALSALIAPYISPTNLVVVFVLAEVLAAFYLGRGPAVLVSILGVVVFDYFFIPPVLTLAVEDTEYLLTFLGLFSVGLVISQLAELVRQQTEAVKQREVHTAALYELGRDLNDASSLEGVTQTAIQHVGQTFNRKAAIFLPLGETLAPYVSSPGLTLSEQDSTSAAWAYGHQAPAGAGTESLQEARMRYQPLKTMRGAVGVLGILPTAQGEALARDQQRTLDAFSNQIALAIERARLAEQNRQTEMLEITDKLQNALLNSISHDLRTPLVSITGALSSLMDEGIVLDKSAQRSLVETASEEADRLNRLVGNLLDMTRLESGAMRIKHDACDIQDLVGATLEEIVRHVGDRPIRVNIPDDLPLVSMDFVLIERVLVNVIDNGLKYSPPGSDMEISARKAGAFVEIMVSDRGVGIPPEDLGRIFDKFYRVQRPGNVHGTGLGLAIGKGIVEAHGGFISAENRPGGGTTITVALPVESPK